MVKRERLFTLTGRVFCDANNRFNGGLWSIRRIAPAFKFGSIALILPNWMILFVMKCFGISFDRPNFVIYKRKERKDKNPFTFATCKQMSSKMHNQTNLPVVFYSMRLQIECRTPNKCQSVCDKRRTVNKCNWIDQHLRVTIYTQ